MRYDYFYFIKSRNFLKYQYEPIYISFNLLNYKPSPLSLSPMSIHGMFSVCPQESDLLAHLLRPGDRHLWVFQLHNVHPGFRYLLRLLPANLHRSTAHCDGHPRAIRPLCITHSKPPEIAGWPFERPQITCIGAAVVEHQIQLPCEDCGRGWGWAEQEIGHASDWGALRKTSPSSAITGLSFWHPINRDADDHVYYIDDPIVLHMHAGH